VSPATPPTGVNFADIPAPRKRATNNNTKDRPRAPRNPATRPSSDGDDFDPSDYA
jgi:hypothetical protein